MLVSPELEQQAIAWRRHLHAHPELSFEEHETTRYIEQALAEIGGLELERPTETGVVARLHGARAGKTLALRADIDALPITEETGIEFASTRPGAMHACVTTAIPRCCSPRPRCWSAAATSWPERCASSSSRPRKSPRAVRASSSRPA